MITDDERREVAEMLRELPSDTYDAIKEWVEGGIFIDASIGDEADYSQIHNAIFGCFPAEHMHPGDYEELHERLADLIDRPTCHDVGDLDNEAFKCSLCGHRVLSLGGDICDAVVVSPDGLISEYCYCPNCGAMVTEVECCNVPEL